MTALRVSSRADLANETLLLELRQAGLDAVHRLLALGPRNQFIEARLKARRRLETEHLARSCGISDAVTNVPRAVSGNQHGINGEPETLRQRDRYLSDRHRLALADVASLPGLVSIFNRPYHRLGDVGDVDEVPALLAILEHQRRLPVLEA